MNSFSTIMSNPLIIWTFLVIFFGVVGMSFMTMLSLCDTDSFDEEVESQDEAQAE